jgi:uncharacterized protein (DUF58 family)
MFSFLRKRLAKAVAAPAASSTQVNGNLLPDAEQWLHRLEWTVIKRLDGLLQGDYRSLFRGTGLILADLREYQTHDDVRHIDWNVTARMQTPYVREHQEDREIAAWFVVDLSGSMVFGSEATSKHQLACSIVTVLAQVLSQHGNRVGLILFNGQTRPQCIVPTRAGKRHVLHIVHQMLKAGSRDATLSESTDLSVWLHHVQALVRRRAAIFLVSDFISPPGWQVPISQMARRHDVVAVRLRDPLEMAWPDSGMVMVQDAESGEQLLVDGNDTVFRKRFAQKALERELALMDNLASAGVDCLELTTDEPLDQALLRFAKLRKRASQLSRSAHA